MAVTGVRLQLDQRVAGRLRRGRECVLLPGQRGQRAAGPRVECPSRVQRMIRSGESSTMTQATTAITAPTPTRTMTALR